MKLSWLPMRSLSLRHAKDYDQCSYMDLFIDRGTVHLFIPHRWQQVTYLRFPENLLPELPTAAVF